MTEHDEADNEARRERGRALIRKANDQLLRREYAGAKPPEAAPGIPISRELSALLRTSPQ